MTEKISVSEANEDNFFYPDCYESSSPNMTDTPS